MPPIEPHTIAFRDADALLRRRVVAKLNVPGRHRLSERTIHLEDGFTILAMHSDEPVAVISV